MTLPIVPLTGTAYEQGVQHGQALKDRIAHVQIADNPGRNEPGTGEINYPAIFEALSGEGYDGFVGCEYKPACGTSAGLGWARGLLGR